MHDQSCFTLAQVLAFDDEVEQLSTFAVPVNIRKLMVESLFAILVSQKGFEIKTDSSQKISCLRWIKEECSLPSLAKGKLTKRRYLLQHQEAHIVPLPDLVQLDNVRVVLD